MKRLFSFLFALACMGSVFAEESSPAPESLPKTEQDTKQIAPEAAEEPDATPEDAEKPAVPAQTPKKKTASAVKAEKTVKAEQPIDFRGMEPEDVVKGIRGYVSRNCDKTGKNTKKNVEKVNQFVKASIPLKIKRNSPQYRKYLEEYEKAVQKEFPEDNLTVSRKMMEDLHKQYAVYKKMDKVKLEYKKGRGTAALEGTYLSVIRNNYVQLNTGNIPLVDLTLASRARVDQAFHDQYVESLHKEQMNEFMVRRAAREEELNKQFLSKIEKPQCIGLLPFEGRYLPVGDVVKIEIARFEIKQQKRSSKRQKAAKKKAEAQVAQ